MAVQHWTRPTSTTQPEPPPSQDDDHDDDAYEVPKEVRELRDRVERLRDYLDDIALADDADPITIARQYQHFLEDAEALRLVLDAVLPGEGEQQ
jgi:hypothetical protein